MIILLMMAVAWASGQADFEAGVAAVRTGNHADAVELFTRALDEGARDPAVYHGLGNALYRQDKTGLAIAAWRRGHALAPRDGDIKANLDRARRETRDRLDTERGTFGPFFWQSWLSPADSALASSLFIALALLSLLVRRLGRRSRWGWETALSGAIGLVLAASTLAALRQPPGAVMVLEEVSARSALGPAGMDLFVLHEGAEVRVLELTGDHALVQLADERKGWMPAASLISTDPSLPFVVGTLR